MENASISDRVRSLRTRRGMTQEELAEKAGLSLAVIRKIEQGGTGRMETYHQLARALGVTTVWFVSPQSPEPVEARVDDAVLADMRSAINPPVSLDGTLLYGTADGDLPDLARLGSAINSVAAKYHADAYDDLAVMVPALVRSAHHHVNTYDTGDQLREALRLRANITGLAGRYLIQIRAHDLALIALQTSLRDAIEIGHTPLAAASISGQAWAMLRQGRFSEVEQLCATTADQTEPRMSTAVPDQLASWGHLLLWAAAAAARNNKADQAREYTSVASTAGARLRRQHGGLAGENPFGPLNPAFMGTEIELLDHRPDQALSLAEQAPRGVGETTSTLVRHQLDVAFAQMRIGNLEAAEDTLMKVRHEAPAWMRYQQYARDIVRELLAARPRMPSARTQELADFMGVEP